MAEETGDSRQCWPPGWAERAARVRGRATFGRVVLRISFFLLQNEHADGNIGIMKIIVIINNGI